MYKTNKIMNKYKNIIIKNGSKIRRGAAVCMLYLNVLVFIVSEIEKLMQTDMARSAIDPDHKYISLYSRKRFLLPVT